MSGALIHKSLLKSTRNMATKEKQRQKTLVEELALVTSMVFDAGLGSGWKVNIISAHHHGTQKAENISGRI